MMIYYCLLLQITYFLYTIQFLLCVYRLGLSLSLSYICFISSLFCCCFKTNLKSKLVSFKIAITTINNLIIKNALKVIGFYTCLTY